MKNDGWTQKFPKKAGFYWFYSYRYGKVSCGHVCEPELMLMEVWENGMGIANGQFVSKKEFEEGWFKKAILPKLPELKKEAN